MYVDIPSEPVQMNIVSQNRGGQMVKATGEESFY